jgi:hypothetical protein
MFTFACIAGGFIIASTVVALLVPAGPDERRYTCLLVCSAVN